MVCLSLCLGKQNCFKSWNWLNMKVSQETSFLGDMMWFCAIYILLNKLDFHSENMTGKITSWKKLFTKMSNSHFNRFIQQEALWHKDPKEKVKMSSSSDEEDGLDVTDKSITNLKNQKCDSSFRETSKRKNRPEDKLCSRLGSQKEERVTSRSGILTRN